MHNVKNILVLGFNFDADSLALSFERGLQIDQPNFSFIRFCKQNHIEKAVQNILVYAKNINFIISQNFCDSRDNSDSVFADNSYNQLH